MWTAGLSPIMHAARRVCLVDARALSARLSALPRQRAGARGTKLVAHTGASGRPTGWQAPSTRLCRAACIWAEAEAEDRVGKRTAAAPPPSSAPGGKPTTHRARDRRRRKKPPGFAASTSLDSDIACLSICSLLLAFRPVGATTFTVGGTHTNCKLSCDQ